MKYELGTDYPVEWLGGPDDGKTIYVHTLTPDIAIPVVSDTDMAESVILPIVILQSLVYVNDEPFRVDGDLVTTEKRVIDYYRISCR